MKRLISKTFSELRVNVLFLKLFSLIFKESNEYITYYLTTSESTSDFASGKVFSIL